jgi:predicted DCC family thiol-disulfide oxidoreductase YuxK
MRTVCCAVARCSSCSDATAHAACVSPRSSRIRVDTFDPESFVLIDGERSWTETAAVLRVAHALGWPWRLAWLAWLIPYPLRDFLYRWVARNRYRWFGRRDVCFVPNADDADRFIR